MNKLIIFTIFLILPCIFSEIGYTQVRYDGVSRQDYQQNKKSERMDTNAAIQKGRDVRDARNLARIKAANTYSYSYRNYYVPAYPTYVAPRVSWGYRSCGYGTYFSPLAYYNGRGSVIIRTR
jgi:hypothetical protein